jgi:hypothetical protein
VSIILSGVPQNPQDTFASFKDLRKKEKEKNVSILH